jgi:hypothetical protein
MIKAVDSLEILSSFIIGISTISADVFTIWMELSVAALIGRGRLTGCFSLIPRYFFAVGLKLP